MNLVVEFLTKANFHPFGDVIERDSDSCFETNNGEVLRHHDLAKVQVTASQGRALISIFQVVKPAELPLNLRLIERHPISSQAFIPLIPTRFLVVVAPPTNRLAISSLRCFLAREGQGINLHVGVWHHPIIAFEKIDFLVIDRTANKNGFDQDYDEIYLEPRSISVVNLPEES